MHSQSHIQSWAYYMPNKTHHTNMKIAFYILTTLFGFYGVLAVLRTIELLATGGGFQPVSALIGIVALVLAFACLKKARAKAAQPK